MIYKFHAISLLFLAVMNCFDSNAQVNKTEINSPDRAVVFSVFIVNGQPVYQISRLGKPIIEKSVMGGLVIGGKQFGSESSFHILKRRTVNEKYLTRGVHSLASNHYNSVLFHVNGISPYVLEVRVFNEGVAFRYLVDSREKSIVNAELTEFTIPIGSVIWSQTDINYYEGKFTKRKIEEVEKGLSAGPPLTIKLAGNAGYASITEAGLIDFAGMSLRAEGNRVFKTILSGGTSKNGKIETPWRIVMVGKDLNQLVNNDLISNVSPPADPAIFPQGYNSDWIKPGKSLWSWMADNGPVSFDNMKRFSNWAGELGFQYNLVDEGWSDWKEKGKDHWTLMKELVDYSAAKGVKIWIWKAYPDRKGVTGIKNRDSRIAFFKKSKELGIAGVKIDFFDSEGQEIIDFYQAALRDAADFQLMLIFHGSNKATGESRTWPNELSREGILGLEAGESWPSHNVALIFTRFLAGHADFTPLTLGSIAKGTTISHQVATVASFTSPFMCLGVNPEALLKSPVKTMVQQIPVLWDETIILSQSEIGDLSLMARRSGSTWFLIGLNGESGRTVNVDLSFLGKGNYYGEIIKDDLQNPSNTSSENGIFNREKNISIKMLSGGGYVGRFYQ